MNHSSETTERLLAIVLIFLFLMTFYIDALAGMRDKAVLTQSRLDSAEKTIESYEKELEKYDIRLDTEVDKNVQLSATITELQDKLTTMENEMNAFTKEHENCRPPIGYSYDNVLEPSNVTAEELSAGLLYELKNFADCFIKAEGTYGVNAIFLASVAALESGWGRSQVAINNNNLFGYTSPSGGYRVFESVEECIDTVARHLKRNYLTEGGSFYNGVSVGAINIMYCAQRTWAEKVNSIAIRVVERISKI